ncbi:MAG: preprotein translocase subunit SecG, partial [Betaproteobacteria bacterium]
NFLSKSTKWLSITFFTISLGMAWYATHKAVQTPAQQDLGVMGKAPAPQAPAPNGQGIPVAPKSQPALPQSTVPSLPQPQAAPQTSPQPSSRTSPKQVPAPHG